MDTMDDYNGQREEQATLIHPLFDISVQGVPLSRNVFVCPRLADRAGVAIHDIGTYHAASALECWTFIGGPEKRNWFLPAPLAS